MNSPRSALAAGLHKGIPEPRLFTPPLTELTPETSYGFDCIDFLEGVLKWKLMPWQKWLYIHALEKDHDNCPGAAAGWHPFRFSTICVLVARQNGKTQWLKGLGLWRLYIERVQQVLISAQNLEFAENTLAEAVREVLEHPLTRKEFSRFSQTNGKYKLILTGGREWRAAVSSRRGARSLSVDLAMLDELREHQNWQAWDAIVATTIAKPRSQVVCASNAGDATSVVLRSLRDGALANIAARRTTDTQTGLFEYSIGEEDDYLDPQFWPRANPGMGYLFDERALRGKLEAMSENLPGWRTEHCCQWVDTLEPGIIPAQAWAATTDPASRRADDAPLWASVDVNFARTRSYICIAARRDDGLQHWEVIASDYSTEWLFDWFATRPNRFAGVVIQNRSAPASNLIDPLRAAGVPVIELGGAELTRAYGYAYDLITERKMRHRPSPMLDAAAESAKARFVGDAWVIDRKTSPVDASPLVGCIQAAWAEAQTVPDVDVWGILT